MINFISMQLRCILDSHTKDENILPSIITFYKPLMTDNNHALNMDGVISISNVLHLSHYSL